MAMMIGGIIGTVIAYNVVMFVTYQAIKRHNRKEA